MARNLFDTEEAVSAHRITGDKAAIPRRGAHWTPAKIAAFKNELLKEMEDADSEHLKRLYQVLFDLANLSYHQVRPLLLDKNEELKGPTPVEIAIRFLSEKLPLNVLLNAKTAPHGRLAFFRHARRAVYLHGGPTTSHISSHPIHQLVGVLYPDLEWTFAVEATKLMMSNVLRMKNGLPGTEMSIVMPPKSRHTARVPPVADLLQPLSNVQAKPDSALKLHGAEKRHPEVVPFANIYDLNQTVPELTNSQCTKMESAKDERIKVTQELKWTMISPEFIEEQLECAAAPYRKKGRRNKNPKYEGTAVPLKTASRTAVTLKTDSHAARSNREGPVCTDALATHMSSHNKIACYPVITKEAKGVEVHAIQTKFAPIKCVFMTEQVADKNCEATWGASKYSADNHNLMGLCTTEQKHLTATIAANLQANMIRICNCSVRKHVVKTEQLDNDVCKHTGDIRKCATNNLYPATEQKMWTATVAA